MTALLKELLWELNRKIAEAEMRSTARTEGLVILMRDGADTTEQERLMWEDMHVLEGLRRDRQVLTEALERPNIPASAQNLLDLADAKLYLAVDARLRLQDLKD